VYSSPMSATDTDGVRVRRTIPPGMTLVAVTVAVFGTGGRRRAGRSDVCVASLMQASLTAKPGRGGVSPRKYIP